ncbi:MAG: Leucyl aminopeptidase [Phycisphaerales bacterium]|nr:Leucyl aminopeptidase [Phycisphaerales bacterium]
MNDPRYTQLARLLTTHSMAVTPGDKVLVESFEAPPSFVIALIREIAAAGGHPIVTTYDQRIQREMIKHATKEQMSFLGEVEMKRMEGVQCYAGVRGSHNISEMSDIAPEKMELYEKHWWTPVHQSIRVPKTRWVVLRWPSPSMAQNAGMSTEAFEDFYFRVCAGVDYAKMATASKPLADLMTATNDVRLVGPGTDLTFSIKGLGGIACTGERNIPDGECFTSPVRDSINGTILYNAETIYRGQVFKDIALTFKSGKIIDAIGDSPLNTKKLNDILDADEGARHIGEFAIGYNPHVLKPMRDILFDEKISGSFHFTPGQAYEGIADNGNRSQIHWDMVNIQRPDYGGGEIWFDGKMIRKDGLFTLPELAALNPDKLGV